MIIDLVLRQLGRRKSRTVLTIMGVAIGIVLVTTLSAISEGINGVVNSNLGALSGKITIVSEGLSFGSYSASEVDELILREIQDFPGIDKATGLLSGEVPGLGPLLGIRMDDVELFNLDVDAKEGRFPEEGEDEIMLGSKYADTSDLRVGDDVTIRSKKYSVIGVLDQTGTDADYSVITSFEPSQEILRKKDKVTIIIAKPINVEDSETLAREIKSTYSDIDALSEKGSARRAQNFTGQLSTATFFLGGISAFIAGIGIMNVMFMSVRERRKEIGVMKALGATTNEVLSQVIMEAIMITLIGEFIGLLISVGAVSVLNSFMPPEMSASITPSLLVFVTLFAIALGIFSGLLPAREAARLDPAIVLRYE